MTTVTQEPFGSMLNPTTGEQQSVTKFIVKNASGSELHLITYGAAVTNLLVPDKLGKLEDVVLGFDNFEGYLGVKVRNPYFGGLVGRVANRIGNAKFELEGVEYHLSKNNGENSLHGGVACFGRVLWQPFVHSDGRVTFTYSSPHLDEGYPGHLFAQVTYTFTNINELIIDFKALTDRSTPVSLTSHSYFNLAGHGAGSKELYEHRVELQADHYTPVDASCLVTGEILAVKGTAFDLSKETRLGNVIHNVPNAKGFDHNFAIRSSSNDGRAARVNGVPLVAKLWHPPSGRLLQVYSDQPGIQFYTGNNLPSDGTLVGKNKTVYSIHGGLCLETQNFPNAINQPNFPNSVLQPGELYQRTAVYKFSVQ